MHAHTRMTWRQHPQGHTSHVELYTQALSAVKAEADAAEDGYGRPTDMAAALDIYSMMQVRSGFWVVRWMGPAWAAVRAHAVCFEGAN